jgi:hypothetical protein
MSNNESSFFIAPDVPPPGNHSLTPMTITVFTIVARNYYGLAQVLRKSVLRHHDNIEFLVFIADGITDTERGQFGPDAIDAAALMGHYVSPGKRAELAFKYNLTEYCTSIKPFCFQHLFDTTDCREAIYLDPDVFVFAPMTPIFEKLAYASIVLTPHILFPSSREGKGTDSSIMSAGIFNLGFAGVRRSNSGIAFIKWWGQRLLDQCFADSHCALFTDQKWVDFVPALFPTEDIAVIRHCGTNIAPWNFHERRVSKSEDDQLWVERRVDASDLFPTETGRESEPVVFAHFSGFDYKRLCSGEVAQYNIDGLTFYPDLQPLIDCYMTAIQADRETVLKFLGMTYRYATFKDGSPIIAFHRRLLRSAVDAGMHFDNPFAVGAGSLHQRLVDSRLLLEDGTEAAQLDKSTKNNMAGLERKLAMVNRVMRGVKWVIGFRRYLLLLRLMRPYSRAESQLHLIDSRKNKL